MKDFYELLGVTTDMSCEEIEKALAGKSLTDEEKEAYETLTNLDARKEYDETLTPVKKTSIKKLVFYGTLGLLLIGGTGLAIANGINNSKNTKVEGTATPGVTDEPEEEVKSTPAPTAVPTATPTPSPTVTPAPTPTPIVAEKVEKLSSENIDEVARQKTEQFNKKGLQVSVEDVKSALLVANIENIDKEELDIIIANTTIGNEIASANNLAVAITTNNINVMYSNDVSKYIAASELIYGENDKKVIEHLDATTIWFVSAMNEGTLTKERYNSSLNYISNFYMEISSLEIENQEYSYSDLTSGAKYVSEMYSWPNLSVAYTISEHSDDKSFARIAATQTVANDGIRYMTDLSICVEPKQLTK